MKRTKNKIVALILAAIMIFSVIPFSVLAAGRSDITIATISDIHYYADSLKGNRTEDYQALVAGSTTTLDLTSACLDTALITMEKELENNQDIEYKNKTNNKIDIKFIYNH